MKPIRGLLTLIIVVAMLLASTLSAGAIGFEAETAYESVFVIYSGSSLGSGFAVGENCIVTNAHVIRNMKQISVIAYDGAEYQASVLGINENEDIAVLIVNEATFPFLPVADLTTMKTGDDIYAIGAPKGMAYTLTKGGISAKERMIRNRSYIQIDAAINEGNSGGPLLNDSGEVLGMNTLKMSDSEGLGLAIPITRVCEYLKSLGVELNTNGNVINRIEIPEEKPHLNTENRDEGNANNNDNNDNKGKENNEGNEDNETNHSDYHEDDKLPTITYIAFIAAGLSLIGNIALAVLLKQEKKKSITLQYDPRERTDFDIDIWE